MCLDALDVCLQVSLALGVGGGVGVVHEGCERHFRVDDDFAALVEVEDDVGTQGGAVFGLHHVAAGIADVGLRVVVYASLESLQLSKFLQTASPAPIMLLAILLLVLKLLVMTKCSSLSSLRLRLLLKIPSLWKLKAILLFST